MFFEYNLYACWVQSVCLLGITLCLLGTICMCVRYNLYVNLVQFVYVSGTICMSLEYNLYTFWVHSTCLLDSICMLFLVQSECLLGTICMLFLVQYVYVRFNMSSCWVQSVFLDTISLYVRYNLQAFIQHNL